MSTINTILRDPGVASRDDGIFMGESLQQERESPGHLLLPIQFQKRLNSLLLIFFWPISEEEQPGDSHVFLHEVVFLINSRSSVARSTGTFLRRASEKKRKKRSRGNRKLRGRKKTNTHREFFTADSKVSQIFRASDFPFLQCN